MSEWVISLCDYTGHMAAPWVHFGYNALLVDPQHEDLGNDRVLKFPGTIVEALPIIQLLIRHAKVRLVIGFPPCTDVALSGTRWWEGKFAADRYFQAKAAIVAEQCRMVGELSGAPWLFENPMSAFSQIFGPPQYKFHPFEFSAYCDNDQYGKETWLWVGGGFKMPPKRHDPRLGPPDKRIWEAPPSSDRANFRSMTPIGFARAVFLANCPQLTGNLEAAIAG